MKKIIRVKTFDADSSPGYASLESWQEQNPDKKILDTKMFTETQTFTSQKIMITYEDDLEEEK